MREIIEIIKEVREARGPKLKSQILERNKDNELLRKVLLVTYNPKNNYGMSMRTIKKLQKDLGLIKGISEFSNIFDLLELLNSNNINNNLRSKFMLFLQDKSEEEQDLYIGMVTNDLRLGVGITSINKVFDNLIEVFNVQLAGKYKEEFIEDGEEFFLTEKLNGIRCLYVNGELISRQGKVFKGLDHIKKQIESLNLSDFVLDGELKHKNDGEVSDNENFRRTTALVNSDEEDKTNINFELFDIITNTEFKKKKGCFLYKARRRLLDDTVKKRIEELNLTNLTVTPLIYHGTDKSKIMEYLAKYTAMNKEGIMLNKNVPYECTRHTGILKVKKMQTVDLLVTNVIEGRRDMEGMLGAVQVDYKGFTVNVGSGFSKEQRVNFWNDHSLIIGRIIEVQYFEETKTKAGDKKSLQFPVFKGVRYDKTEPSYN